MFQLLFLYLRYSKRLEEGRENALLFHFLQTSKTSIFSPFYLVSSQRMEDTRNAQKQKGSTCVRLRFLAANISFSFCGSGMCVSGVLFFRKKSTFL
mmetsp:Transcript_30756/g.80466  ORF Transcript_30756/g.80466 Transcript_30756/m.80466 type:complete len:96 (+) Transcript_30756:500-787(+)